MKAHAVQIRLMEHRLSFERRSFDYSNHIPERRSGRDRRQAPETEDDEPAELPRRQPEAVERIIRFKAVLKNVARPGLSSF